MTKKPYLCQKTTIDHPGAHEVETIFARIEQGAKRIHRAPASFADATPLILDRGAVELIALIYSLKPALTASSKNILTVSSE